MQETDYDGKIHQEFFQGETNKEVRKKMDERLKELKAQGHTLSKRVKISRNAPCPCGSGKKFKKCCIGKVK